MAQSLWGAAQQFLIKLNILLLYDLAIAFPGIYAKELKTDVTQKPAHGCL